MYFSVAWILLSPDSLWGKYNLAVGSTHLTLLNGVFWAVPWCRGHAFWPHLGVVNDGALTEVGFLQVSSDPE